MADAGEVARRLLQVGVLIAPPLIISESQVDWAVDRLTEVLEQVASLSVPAQHEEEASG
jgi:ornithine--oxo-acid transaminase